jgi:hypothetical protein
MTDLFTEWTRDDLTYGVLLSGGSDSRFVQAAIDQPVVSLHNADWMSREARIAEWVTEVSGDEFRLLKRTDDHEARSLETTPHLSNFSGWFDQAYFTALDSQDYSIVDPSLADDVQYNTLDGAYSGKTGFQEYMHDDRAYSETKHTVTDRYHLDDVSICPGDFHGVTPDETIDGEFCDFFRFDPTEQTLTKITVYSRR